jgi:hypothetical protein
MTNVRKILDTTGLNEARIGAPFSKGSQGPSMTILERFMPKNLESRLGFDGVGFGRPHPSECFRTKACSALGVNAGSRESAPRQEIKAF